MRFPHFAHFVLIFTAAVCYGDPMEPLSKVSAAIADFSSKYRAPGLPHIEISKPVDLFPDAPQKIELGAHTTWKDSWPFATRPGVYIIYSSSLDLIYIGKTSMNRCIGKRLYEYFGDGPECIIKKEKLCKARVVVIAAVPKDMPFEAPALEEYLIKKLQPPQNDLGK